MIHLIRNTFRFASKGDWDRSPGLRTIYTAATAAAAEPRSTSSSGLGQPYPAIIRLWRNAWEQFIPFLEFAGDPHGGLTTNAIESLNARFRQATRRRGHFPNEQAALKVLYLVIRTPHRNRANVTGTTTGWKKAINALAMYYGERITLDWWR